MEMTAETVLLPALDEAMRAAEDRVDRRSDIEGKQLRVAELLREVGCDGLLGVVPETFAWLTSGATPRGILDWHDMPYAYYSADQRWLIASNVDTQRFFDEELDGLGFQLKEWAWHQGRDQLVADLTFGRKIACDRPASPFTAVGDKLRAQRLSLTRYEQACLQVVGPLVSHALEATCRTVAAGTTEREIAGQISHRLLHRGVQPLAIEIAADGRSRRYRQCGSTSTPVRNYAVMTVVGRKYGLCATSTRSVMFGSPDADFRREFDAASRVMATYVACTWPDALPQQILTTGRHVYQLAGFEHEWRLSTQGHLTGHAPVEQNLMPKTEMLLRADSAITWKASIGAAMLSDTYLISDKGARIMTSPELWPVRTVRFKGTDCTLPDILQR
jgi:Xaa-Pro aminopeptidase